MNLFYLLLIQFFILKKYISKIINNNRIENALKQAISSIEKIPKKNDSIELKYEKYSIFYDNVRIIDIDTENITITNSSQIEQDDFDFYSLENIKFTFAFDSKFFRYNDFSFEEKDNFMEINCPEIIYKYNSENISLNLDYFNISNFFYYSINFDSGIDNLNYYKEMREKAKCLCKNGTGEEFVEEYPDVYIVYFLKNLIMYYLSTIELNDILLSYDIKMIIEKTLMKIDNLKDKSDILKFEYVQINKILIPFDQIETRINNTENKLIINNIKFFGIFNLSDFNKEYEFKFELNETQKIEFFNRTLNFNFDNILIETNFDEKTSYENELIESLKLIMVSNYTEIIKKPKNDYYKSYIL
jgi:preprotein translocase subunit SecB